MDLKSRLESHSITTLKKEISKTNVKGYSKMKKAEVVALMLKHSDRFNHIKHSKSEEFKKEKTKEIMSKNEKTEVKSKGDFEKLKVKGIEYFYNKKNQKLYDVNTKKLVGKIEKGQVVLKKKEEPKKEEPKKEEPKKEEPKKEEPKIEVNPNATKIQQEALKLLEKNKKFFEDKKLTRRSRRGGRIPDLQTDGTVATLYQEIKDDLINRTLAGTEETATRKATYLLNRIKDYLGGLKKEIKKTESKKEATSIQEINRRSAAVVARKNKKAADKRDKIFNDFLKRIGSDKAKY